MREAVVRQQLHRGAAGKLVQPAGPDAVLLRQLPGRDRRPHRLGRRWMQRRQMPDGAGVENAAEVRQPALRGRAGNQVERCRVERDHRHTRGSLDTYRFERRFDRARFEERRPSARA